MAFDAGRGGRPHHHLITDTNGLPRAIRITAANLHESRLFDALINAVPPVRQGRGRPCRYPAKLHADKAYDLPRCRGSLPRQKPKDRTLSGPAELPLTGRDHPGIPGDFPRNQQIWQTCFPVCYISSNLGKPFLAKKSLIASTRSF
jgi:hypothetical protein